MDGYSDNHITRYLSHSCRWRVGWGLVAMARGGKLGPQRSNMFMRYRILFQGIAILLVIILLAIAKD